MIDEQKGKMCMSSFLVVTTTLLVIGSLVLLFFKDPPEGIRTLAIAAITTIFNKWGTIFDYLFGSSKGSADKTALLNEQPKQKE